jgi:uncharacterized protein (DUF58 family)
LINRFLDPRVLAGIVNLELTAKTVVEGFISGLHRSPHYGFSQEFAEFRPYVPGDDLRYVDWNVYARTERLYLKKFQGETNTRVTVLLDASASMDFERRGVRKIDYARFLAASMAYLAHHQRDAVGLITFNDKVREFIEPSSRQGQWIKVLHGLNRSEAGKRTRTDFAEPFHQFQQFLNKPGLVLVVSDFLAPVNAVLDAVKPLAHRGNDVVLMHVLDPEELDPVLEDSRILVDLETGEEMEVSPEFAAKEYPRRIKAHAEALREGAQSNRISYHLALSNEPLDAALRRYLAIRQGRM